MTTDEEFDIDDNAPDEGESELDDNVVKFIDRIIGAFEDFLWCHNVDLRNNEPRSEEDEDLIIYGRDYDDLFNDIYEAIDAMYGGV